MSRYIESYSGVYEGENALNRIFEEIFADAYAGINAFRVKGYAVYGYRAPDHRGAHRSHAHQHARRSGNRRQLEESRSRGEIRAAPAHGRGRHSLLPHEPARARRTAGARRMRPTTIGASAGTVRSARRARLPPCSPSTWRPQTPTNRLARCCRRYRNRKTVSRFCGSSPPYHEKNASRGRSGGLYRNPCNQPAGYPD